MPQCFKKLYPSTRIIFDGTEIFIEKASDYVVHSSTYSQYKSHSTARGIIGITPSGFVSFVSNLYPGRISERDVILRSGILLQLQEGDSAMADRGFTIQDDLRSLNCDLNIPPFLGGAPQLTYEDERITRDIASMCTNCYCFHDYIKFLKAYLII